MAPSEAPEDNVATTSDSKHLSTLIEQSTSNRSSRHLSPPPVGGVSTSPPPVEGSLSPGRATSPNVSDGSHGDGDSEVKARSGAGSRNSLRMSMKTMLSQEELHEVLSPEEIKHILGDMETVSWCGYHLFKK